jgi:hypothetical protein
MGRKGTVFADHYHARQLRSPTEVANAIRYVLLNFVHHFQNRGGGTAENQRVSFSSVADGQRTGSCVVHPSSWLLSAATRYASAADGKCIAITAAT